MVMKMERSCTINVKGVLKWYSDSECDDCEVYLVNMEDSLYSKEKQEMRKSLCTRRCGVRRSVIRWMGCVLEWEPRVSLLYRLRCYWRLWLHPLSQLQRDYRGAVEERMGWVLRSIVSLNLFVGECCICCGEWFHGCGFVRWIEWESGYGWYELLHDAHDGEQDRIVWREMSGIGSIRWAFAVMFLWWRVGLRMRWMMLLCTVMSITRSKQQLKVSVLLASIRSFHW